MTFLRILPDGTFKLLLSRSFYYDSGQPKTSFTAYRGLGYELSEAFEEESVVELTAIHRRRVPLYGSEEGAVADVLDEGGARWR